MFEVTIKVEMFLQKKASCLSSAIVIKWTLVWKKLRLGIELEFRKIEFRYFNKVPLKKKKWQKKA